MAAATNYNNSSSSDEMNADNEVGYSFELVDNKFEAKFTCICCHLIIRNFMEVRCGNGHAGCRYCIEEWERRMHSEGPTALCIQCRVEYKKSDKQLSEYMDNFINEMLEYRCKQHKRGCTWTGAINDYIRTHKQECGYRKQKCPNHQCSERLQRRNLDKHVQNECKYRTKICSFCLKDYFVGLKDEHERTDCFILCENTNAGCTVQVSPNNMEQHKLNCDYATVPCIYEKYGCTHKILRNQMQNHIARDALNHNALFIEQIDKLTLQNENSEKKLDKTNSEKINVQKENEELKNQIGRLQFKLKKHNLKWNQTIIYEVQFERKKFAFNDVYKILINNEYEHFDRLVQTAPHLLNSLRDSNYNLSLLMQAASDGKQNVFGKLLEYQHDLSIVDRGGSNVFHRVAYYRKDVWWFDELKKTIHHASELKDLINKKNIDGETSLHYAALCNRYENVKWLLSNNVDVDVTNNVGERADEDRRCDAETKRLIREYHNK